LRLPSRRGSSWWGLISVWRIRMRRLCETLVWKGAKEVNEVNISCKYFKMNIIMNQKLVCLLTCFLRYKWIGSWLNGDKVLESIKLLSPFRGLEKDPQKEHLSPTSQRVRVELLFMYIMRTIEEWVWVTFRFLYSATPISEGVGSFQHSFPAP
jgi:hypothetical protein